MNALRSQLSTARKSGQLLYFLFFFFLFFSLSPPLLMAQRLPVIEGSKLAAHLPPACPGGR